MRKKNAYLAIVLLLLIFVGCQKRNDLTADETVNQGIPKGIIERLKAQGYSTYGIIPYRDGYLVEGDMYITTAQLTRTNQRSVVSEGGKTLNVGRVAQYRTTNLVTGSSTLNFRVIKVLMNPSVPPAYFTALDNALTRYNNAGINLIFLRVDSNADIVIDVDNSLGTGVYGGAGGPPSATGNPNSQIWINQTTLGANPDQGFLTTFFAHEIGHCLGFRHTDYFDRSLSGCPYHPALAGGYNEGSTGSGAIHIPGTPTGMDNGSWMLACSSPTENRPFTSNDLIALRNLYPSNSSFCNSATYSISNLPAGATVNWSVNNPTKVTLMNNGDGTVTLYSGAHTNDQNTLLTATISVGVNTYLATKNISFNGSPVLDDIFCYFPLNPTNYYTDSYYIFRLTYTGTAPNQVQWSYRVTGTTTETIVNSSNTDGAFSFFSPGTYDIIARPLDPCSMISGYYEEKTIVVEPF